MLTNEEAGMPLTMCQSKLGSPLSNYIILVLIEH